MPSDESAALPEANALNFIPRLGAPILVLAGRHDEILVPNVDGAAVRKARSDDGHCPAPLKHGDVLSPPRCGYRSLCFNAGTIIWSTT